MKLLSIVIPVYNEYNEIPNFLEKLEIISGNTEVIFVDGGSNDGTVELLRGSGRTVVMSEKGRGKQLIKGVEESSGENLLFLHADSFFDKSPIPIIEETLNTNRTGAFRMRFSREDLLLRLISFNSNNRVMLRNIAFGDQAMFISRAFYDAIGGFKPLALMEDYDLSIRINQAGEKIKLVNQYVYTSPKRFESKGYMRTVLMMQYCQHLFRKGVHPDEIKRIYS